MALTAQEKELVLRNLPSQTARAYAEGLIDDSQLEEFATLTGIKRPEPEVMPRVVPEEESGGIMDILGSLADRAQAGFQSTAAGQTQRAADADYLAQQQEQRPFMQRDIFDFVGFGPDERARTSADVVGLLNSLVTDPSEALPGGRLWETSYQEGTNALVAARDANNKRADEVLAETDTGRWALQIAQDVASSPESALSVIGGPTAVLPMATTYSREYLNARQAGLSPEDADERARVQANIEMGFSAIPTGRVGRAAWNALSDVAATGLRVGGTAVAEGVEEGLTTAAQLAADAHLASNADSEQLREFSRRNLPKDVTEFWSDVWRSVQAGAAGGAALSTPLETMQTVAERGRLAAELTSQFRNQQGPAPLEREIPAIQEEETQEDEIQQQADFVPDEVIEDRVRSLDSEDAYLARERERNAEALRNSMANRVDTLRQRAEILQDDIEAGDRSQGTLRAFSMVNSELRQAETLLRNQEDRIAARPNTLTVRASIDPTTPQERPPFITPSQPEPLPVTEPVAPTPIPAPDEDLDDSEDLSFEDLKAQIGMASATDREPQTTNTDDVLNAMVSTLGQGNTKRLAKLITDGNLQVVNTEQDIPTGAAPAGSAGWYDGNRTYIIADKLNKGNIVGDMLEIAAHEVKHAADLGAPKEVQATFGEFVGQEANTRLNRRIEQLAATGNTVAKAAVDRASKAGTPAMYSYELPAYFINEARDARKRGGRVAGVLSDAVSAVRTAAKNVLPGEYEVNLDDVAYLSDKLINKVAKTGERMQASPFKLPMIMGENAPDFAQAEKEGRVYTSKDGKRKFLMSDSESRLKLTPNKVDLLYEGQYFLLGDLLKHDKLFKNYPQLRDIMVSMDSTLEPYTAQHFAAEDMARLDPKMGNTSLIQISREFIDDAILSEEGSDVLRGVLLHETQHDIQDIEGSALGGNNSIFMSDSDKSAVRENSALREQYTSAVGNVAINFDDFGLNSAAVNQISRASNNRANNSISHKEYVSELWQALNHPLNNLTDQGLEAKTRLRDSALKYHQSTQVVREIVEDSYQKYYSLLGEQEAYNTQFNRNLTQEQLPVNPEDEDVRAGFSDTQPQNANMYDGSSIIRMTNDVGNQGFSAAYVPPEAQQGLAYNPKNLAAAAQKFFAPENKVMLHTKQLLGTFGGLGRELGRLREEAEGMSSVYSHKAMRYFSQLTDGLALLAKRKGITEDAARKWLENEIQEISNLKTADARERRLRVLVRDNKEVLPFANGVATVNALSKLLLRQMVEMNPNPTPEELKLMNTIHSNSFRYMTRMYEAFQGQEGRARNQKLMNAYNKGRKALATRGVVPNRFKDEFAIWTSAQKFVIDNNLTIPDEDGINELSNEKLDNLYSTWISDATRDKKVIIADAINKGMTETEAREFARQSMREALLAKAPELNTDDYVGKADALLQAMLDLDNAGTPFAEFYRGFRQDRSILQRRQDIPEPIRALFGEITDPGVRMAVTISKMGELAGRTRLLLDMKDKGYGKWVVSAQDAGRPGNERFTTTLQGETFGPLNGWKTTPEIGVAIGDTLEMYSTMTDAMAQAYINSDALGAALARKAGSGLTTAASWQKLTSVVMDLWNLSQNAIGSPIVLMANGVTNPKRIAEALALGAQSVIDTATEGRSTLSEEFTRKLDELVRYGILDSARVQEIRRTPQKFVRDLISTKPKAVSKTWHRARVIKNASVETYAMADAWVKAAAFYDRVDTLNKFYNAEGITRTQSDVKKEAADTIKDTNITYARTPAVVRGTERFGLTTFMPYFVSVYRALMYNIGVGYQDALRSVNAKTPKGRMLMAASSAKRLAGTAAASYGVTYALKAAAAALNDDEDESRLASLQKLMFPDARFADSVYLGKDKDGIPLFMRLSRLDPFGPANDMLRIAMDDETSAEQKRRFIVESYKDMVITNRATSSVVQFAFDLITDEEIKNETTKFEHLAPKAAENIKEWVAAIPGINYSESNTVMEFLSSFIPGMADAIDPRNKSVDPANAASAEYEALSRYVTMMGGRLDRADPGMAAYIAGKELDAVRDEYRRRLSDGVKAERSPNTLQDIFLEGAERERMAMLGVMDVYDGIVNGMGQTPRQASEVLKEDGKLTATDVTAIRRSDTTLELSDWLKSYSRLVNKKSLEGLQRDPELEDQRKEFLATMKALGYNVED